MWGIKNDALYPQRVCIYFLNCQTIQNFFTIYFSKFSDNCIFIHRLFTISGFPQNCKLFPELPDFDNSRFFQNGRSRWENMENEQVFSGMFFQKLSTGWVGLYAIFKVRPVDNFCEKIITGFHAVKRDRANLLLFKSALL